MSTPTQEQLVNAQAALTAINDRRRPIAHRVGRLKQLLFVARGADEAALAEELAAKQLELDRLDAEVAVARQALGLLKHRAYMETVAAARAQTVSVARAAFDAARRSEAEERARIVAAALEQERTVDQPQRAQQRWALCQQDADRGGSGRSTVPLSAYEEQVLRDPARTIDEVAKILGIYPYHAKKMREAPPVKRVPVARPGRASSLSDDQVRELRTTIEPMAHVAVRMGISLSHARSVRYRNACANVPDEVQ